MSDKLDELLEQLNEEEGVNNNEPIPEKTDPEITDENVNDWILSKAGKLIENGMDAVDALKQVILSSGEPHDISAYSEMFKAVVGALDTLGKINIQNKKAASAKELKEMDIKAKSELPEHKGNTNILVATREDIIKNFLEKGKDSIDAEFTEEENGEEND